VFFQVGVWLGKEIWEEGGGKFPRKTKLLAKCKTIYTKRPKNKRKKTEKINRNPKGAYWRGAGATIQWIDVHCIGNRKVLPGKELFKCRNYGIKS